MSEKKRAPALMDEYPILVYPSLAVALGVNRAIVFQQLHFLLNGQKEAKNAYNFIDGKWWVYNSYQEWHDSYFAWLAPVTLKGIFNSLEDDGLIISMQSVKNPSDRRKWYTINYEAWDKFYPTIGQKVSDQPTDKKYPMVGQKISDGYSKTSSETTTNTISRKSAKAVKPPTIPAEQMNPMKDALVEAFGWKWETMTSSEKGLIQVTAKELCTVNFAPDRVASLHAWCKAKFTDFSPRALTTHLSEFRAAQISGGDVTPVIPHKLTMREELAKMGIKEIIR